MGRAVRKARVFIRGVLRGLESPGDTFVVNTYSYPHKSEQEAMRSDWVRVGGEIQTALTKANGEASSRSSR